MELTTSQACLVAHLATGDAAGARRLFAGMREPEAAREALLANVLPDHMAAFVRIAPWLMEPVDKLSTRILAALDAAGRAGLTRTQLRTKVSRVDPVERDETLDRLIRARDVHIERPRTGGAKREVFRLADHARGIWPANINADPGAYRPPLD